MKVNSVLWLYALCVVFLCIFEFGSSTSTSVGRPPTSSTSPTLIIKSPKNSRRQSKISTNTRSDRNNQTETTTNGRNNIVSSRTGVTRPTTPSLLDATSESTKKSVRQLDIPLDRKKTTTPKKYASEGKTTFSYTTSGPTKIGFPKPAFSLSDFPKPTFSLSEKRSSKNSRKQLICPKENEVKFELFPRKCERHKDCNFRTSNELCCSIFGAKSCVNGLPKPLEESTHSPIFGIIPRHCPQRPLAELWWEVKTCETDMDCWPRVCCPDGQRRYCRSSKPELDIVPVPVKRSINYLSEYLECTPAPPPIFDLHPKPCNSTIDCFPNICCQEAGKKHCRPPKKSVLTFMANFLNLGLVKRLTKNIVIK